MRQLRSNPRPHRRTPQTPPYCLAPAYTARDHTPKIPASIAGAHFVRVRTVRPRMHRASPKPMIPAIPARGRDDGGRRMPRAVAHDSLPHTASAVIIISINVSLIAHRSRILRRIQHVDRLARVCAVQIPDIYLPVVAPGVDVAPVRTSRRGEMAPNQRFEDAVAAESDEGAVVRMRVMVIDVVGGESVVEICGVILQSTC